MYVVASGFCDTTGEFLYNYVNVTGFGSLPIHPGWEIKELIENLLMARNSPNAAKLLIKKFQQILLL
jgi:hypothetical protein